MSDEYEFYQGVVLRQLVVNSELSLIMRPFLREGRINAFIINGKVGVFIKHSSKRMTPWRFTFTLEQAADLLDLEGVCFDSFVVFVCGEDGLVTIDVGALHQIVTFDEREHAWVRIERPPRAQYTVSGNRATLPNKIANGTWPIHELILAKLRDRRAS
jgi:hypothetical protein